MSEFETAAAGGARAIPTLVKALQAEYRTASERGRTGFSGSEWRDGTLLDGDIPAIRNLDETLASRSALIVR